MAQVAHDVLHHYHRSVDHHAKVQGAERKQVRRDVPQIQANRSKQERKWNREGHDDRSAHVPQKDEEDNDDQHNAFRQVMQHRMRRQMQQVAPV